VAPLSLGGAIAAPPPPPENAVMGRELFDFATAAAVTGWSAIDDAVMGGVSRSRLHHDLAGHAVFAGVVSLEHNGGFASVRSPALDLGAPGATAWIVDARGDGKRYKLSLRTDDGFDGVSFQAAFAPPPNAWTGVRLPVSAFSATFRGRTVPGAPTLDPGRVRQLGLVIADRQAGPFALAIRSIRAE
jgi:hypothetical protein